MTTTLFTPDTLVKHVTLWELAVVASDVSLFVEPGELSHSMLDVMNRGESEQSAWLCTVGTAMPPVVAAHFALRKKVKSAWVKPKHVARCLAQWVENYRALSTKSFTATRSLCQRLQGFALMASPDEVAALGARDTVCQTLAHVLPECNYNWPVASSVSVLLHLLRGEARGPHPAFVGSSTAIPTSWHPCPAVTHVSADEKLPAAATNRYVVLTTNEAGTEARMLVVSASVGQEEEWVVPVDRDAMPVQWVAAHDTSVVVGTAAGRVACVDVDTGDVVWHSVESGPPVPLVHRMPPYLLWSHRGELEALDLRTLRRVADTSTLQTPMLRQSAHNVAACRQSNMVFSNGKVLFQLPRSSGQHVVAVNRAGEEWVDVFTDVGDWWRVNTQTLGATVVGLDVPSKSKVVDVCGL